MQYIRYSKGIGIWHTNKPGITVSYHQFWEVAGVMSSCSCADAQKPAEPQICLTTRVASSCAESGDETPRTRTPCRPRRSRRKSQSLRANSPARPIIKQIEQEASKPCPKRQALGYQRSIQGQSCRQDNNWARAFLGSFLGPSPPI